LLNDRRIRIREAQKHVDPVDPDPEHCYSEKEMLGLRSLRDQRERKVCCAAIAVAPGERGRESAAQPAVTCSSSL
jgi:hypothetical protein